MGLDSVELIMEIEEHFDINFEDRIAQQMETVGDVLRIVLAKVQAKNDDSEDKSLSEPEVLLQLQKIIARSGGVQIERVTLDARIVSDLGIN